MWVIDSPRNKWRWAAAWVIFSVVNAWLMFLAPGEETIPYHLIWASFALLYGLYGWSPRLTWSTFTAITVVTGVPLVEHAVSRIIGWEECAEIILMGVLVTMLIWHVDRHRLAQARLVELRESERIRAHNRDVAARFGSHEVRTRLTIAHGFVELIRDATEDELYRGDADVVLAELEKATALTTKLLELVRFETAARYAPMDLQLLTDAVLRRWEVTAERAWSSSVGVRTISGDRERLEAALDCLIENAVKFTSLGDAISITVRHSEGAVGIAVRDSGIGIPAEELDRVAQIFQTGSAAGSRAGSGLGLAIVSTVVGARGGTLEVSSVEGDGTCVTMWLPVEAGFSSAGAVPAELPHDLSRL